MEFWNIGRGGRVWAKYEVPEAEAKKPLVAVLRYAIDHRPRCKTFWLVFNAEETARFEEAGKLLVETKPAAMAILDAAIHIFSRTCLGPISSAHVPDDPRLPIGAWTATNTHLAIRFGG
jgi:hypothetical protein